MLIFGKAKERTVQEHYDAQVRLIAELEILRPKKKKKGIVLKFKTYEELTSFKLTRAVQYVE